MSRQNNTSMNGGRYMRPGMWLALLLTVLSMTLLLTAMSGPAYAGPSEPTIKEGTCTSESQYDIPTVDPDSGLVSTIVQRIRDALQSVSSDVFYGITGDSGFQNVIRLASSLYVAIYGILFTFGMVQITIYDMLVRLVKLGIMNVLLSSSGDMLWVLVRFFNDGVDDIIARVSAIAFGTGGVVGATGAPFDPLDQALVFVVSSKMAITLLATFATGPYGLVVGIILLMSLGSFMKSIFNALWVYVMALVIRSLLIGISPIFIVCILFARTRYLFEGWLNQVVNTCLQPIFLFTFFAFFVTLLKSCLSILLDRPVCWMPSQVESGTPNMAHFWRFALKKADGSYQPFDGIWGFAGPEGNTTGDEPNIHPIGIMLPLMIWILADLAGRFNHIVLGIAKQLADASTDFNGGVDAIKAWFGRMTDLGNNKGGGAAGGGAAGGRTGPSTLKGLEDLIKKTSEAKPPAGGPPPKPGEIRPPRPTPK
ncbi:MAG: type IV secretion system protein [Proteobacteria bacterium]|nr:type IV secretion system protein [Pseudomonadota bacterium]